MALKFADTAKPMGVFPVAEAVDIELTKKDDSKKSLQAMYDDGELGGGEGLPLPEQAGMVMMTYENEDGDLDWKQSLLKTVEKVDEIPTTFEDKVYVVDSKAYVLSFDKDSPSLNTEEEEIAFLSQFDGLTWTTSPYGTTGRLNYNLSFPEGRHLDITYTNSTGVHKEVVERLVFTNNHLSFRSNGVDRVPISDYQLSWYGSDKASKAQVYASEVELATKEYADTHGAGAQVYTKAEWDALDPKPADGTQVIITDDTGEQVGDYIISYGQNENGYYRKWKSGFIEQWGKIAKGSNLKAESDWTGYYPLPIPFSNTDFIISVTASTDTTLHAGSELMVRPTSVSQMQVEWYNRNSSTTIEKPVIMWSAKGF